MWTYGGTCGLLSQSPCHHSPGEFAGAEGGRAVVRRHFQHALCCSPFTALVENLCRAPSSPPLACPLLFNFHSLLKAGCQVPLPACMPRGLRAPPPNPACRSAEPQGSARGNAGAGEQIQVRGISSQRQLLHQPQWEQAGGASKAKGGPSPGAAVGVVFPVYRQEGGWGARRRPHASCGSCTLRWK